MKLLWRQSGVVRIELVCGDGMPSHMNHLNLQQTLNLRLPAWCGWPDLALMALAAPWIAGYIHSECVFARGIRLYNAEIGGIYFGGGSMAPYPPPGLGTIALWISGVSIPAIPTFLLLLAFKKRALFLWLAWFFSVAFWTWACFKMEIALH